MLTRNQMLAVHGHHQNWLSTTPAHRGTPRLAILRPMVSSMVVGVAGRWI